jgi:hypothetical protein
MAIGDLPKSCRKKFISPKISSLSVKSDKFDIPVAVGCGGENFTGFVGDDTVSAVNSACPRAV